MFLYGNWYGGSSGRSSRGGSGQGFRVSPSMMTFYQVFSLYLPKFFIETPKFIVIQVFFEKGNVQCYQMIFFQQMILLNELQNSDTPGCQYQTPCLCLSCILAFVKIFWPFFHGNLFTLNLFGIPVEKLLKQKITRLNGMI